MTVLRTRFLRPSVLAVLPSGLWAVDAFQPVAVVVDPISGAVRRRVAWSQLPPPGPRELGDPDREPVAKSDGQGLWVQRELGGPLVCIDEDGVRATVATDGLAFEACGPGVAWCTEWDVVYPGVVERPWASPGRLLRADRDGRTTEVRTRGRVERIVSGARGLFVQLYVPPAAEASTAGFAATRWVVLPWEVELPPEVTATGDDVEVVEEPAGVSWGDLGWDGTGFLPFLSSYQPPPVPSAVVTESHRWALGAALGPPRHRWDHSQVVASAHRSDGVEVARWDLGRGEGVLRARSLGDRLAITVARSGGAAEVLALHPDTGQAQVLLAANSVDITDLAWPMVACPADAQAHPEQVRAFVSQPHWGTSKLADVHITLVGDWPDTQLEWTFRWPTRPGLVLRRRIPLFDELDRTIDTDNLRFNLMETLEGDGLPTADDAVDGYLDL